MQRGAIAGGIAAICFSALAHPPGCIDGAALQHNDKVVEAKLVRLATHFWALLPGGEPAKKENAMGPNPEVWPMLWLSIGVAVVAAWIGDLVATAAVLAAIAGGILFGLRS